MSTSNSLVLTSVHRAYRRRLAPYLGRTRFAAGAQPLPESAIEAVRNGVGFGLVVDDETHVVLAAFYRGDLAAPIQALMEALCELVIGLPIQEVSDHAVIRLEYRLRDPEARPVAGIVTPASADPVFVELTALTREVCDEYCRRIGVTDTSNFYVMPPSDGWRHLSHEARVTWLDRVLRETLRAGGEPPETRIDVLRIDDDVKVTVALLNGVASGATHDWLRRLESAIKSAIDPSLQIYMEEVKDRNVLRRIVAPKEMVNVRHD